MILVDSGFLLALAQPTDALHLRAVAWAERVNEPLLVTEYVLVEVINHLSKPADRSRGHEIVSHITASSDCQVVHASPELFGKGLALHRTRPDKEWSLTDCISFCVMRDWGIGAALAYDHHFEQAGFEALLRRDPGS